MKLGKKINLIYPDLFCHFLNSCQFLKRSRFLIEIFHQISLQTSTFNLQPSTFFKLWLQHKGLMLPPVARQKIQAWIRSRHLICSGNFFIFETLDYSAIERFEDCISSLGGTLISVEPLKKIWMGNHRQVILYHAKASLHTPHHDLKQYWFKYGAFHTRFDLIV